jgi:deoxyxylulose-5-phosphate synthase
MELAGRRRCPCGVLVLGAQDAFPPPGKREELLGLNGLDGPGIAGSILNALEERPLTGCPREALINSIENSG